MINLPATTRIILFVRPRGDAQVYVPESSFCISLMVRRYLDAFSSGTADQPTYKKFGMGLNSMFGVSAKF